jgi:16S rRNA (adenine1518-N6/adenine1519-N6)-dimethyltransferase
MRQVLSAGQIQLTKSLGQNFLHDGNQLRRIIKAAELTQADSVLEIGPGLGPLTELLVARAGRVLAIEKDARLIRILRHRFGAADNLELVHDDALALLRRETHDWSSWKLVANLPYAVASPILVELAECPLPPERMVVTLQLEVARRLMAVPRTADYGVLTLLIQLRYEPRDWFKIAASCFFPEPDVDSACVTLLRRATPPLSTSAANIFTQAVKRSFSERRKMMFKLLRKDWVETQISAAFAKARIDPQARAEAVSLDQFVALSRELACADSFDGESSPVSNAPDRGNT